jgi:hypothetical protein
MHYKGRRGSNDFLGDYETGGACAVERDGTVGWI